MTPERYTDLTDAERLMIERTSYNYFHHVGSNMRIPPRLFLSLKASGVSMKYIDPDPTLEQ